VSRTPATAVRAAAVVTVLGATLSACGGDVGSSSDGSSAAQAGAPDELRLAVGGEAEEGFDPTLGWGGYGSPLFQSTLLRRDADLSITYDLATAYDVSDDGLTWTVDIRTDAAFSDGEPVTAGDVAYTFDTAAEQGGLTDVTVLEEARAVDRDTVELRLTEPRSTFVNRLVSLGIVPEHAHDDDYAQQPVGSGPFELVSWEKGQQLVVQRHDAYYGEKPAFERLVFVFTDEDATLAAARSGAVDVAALPSAMAAGDIDGMRLEAVPSIDNRGIAFPTVPDAGRTTASGAPIGNDVTADRAIRQAVNQAVDRRELVDGVLEGFGTPATGPVDGAPWHDPSATIEDADVQGAVATLEDAGWSESEDGVREKDGVRAELTLLYPAGDSLRQGLALSVVDMVEPAGIAIRTEGVSWEEIDQRLHADAVMFGWGSHDPTEMYNLYHSGQAGTELWNPGFYSNPDVDAHLDAAMRALDEESANRHWRAAQVEGGGFTQDFPWAWLVNLDHTYFVDDCLDLGRLQTQPHGHGWPITAGIESWRWTC
jgi:peptide/nickel transport system substrate-binding protein